ncbi:MAG TPA: hypothetical protein VGK29_28265 [Paludibaculum sp.]|jgi:hypothetical protein
MKKAGLFLIFAATLAFAGEWTGHISETSCGAKHADGSASSVSCVTSCIKRGAKPVLVVDGKVVGIANADKVTAGLYGKKVKITGELAGESLTIATIEAAE